MVKSILLVSLIIFAVGGICELIYLLRMFFYHPGVPTQNYSILVLERGKALKQLNYIWQKIIWNGNDYAKGIIALTDYIEANELLTCNKFIKGKNIILCTANELYEHMQGELF